jgi:chromosome segregation ATPase
MGSSIFQIALYTLGGGILGGAGAWLIQAIIGQRHIDKLTTDAKTSLIEVTAQRDQFANQYSKLRERIGTYQTAIVKRNTEIESLKIGTAKQNKEFESLQGSSGNHDKEVESLKASFAKRNKELESLKKTSAKRNKEFASLKTSSAKRNTEYETLRATFAKCNTEFDSVRKESKLLAENVVALRAEREGTKTKLNTIHKTLDAFKSQTAALQSEFQKSQELYKRELQKSFEKRTQLDGELTDMQFELKKARSKKESNSDVVVSKPAKPKSSEEVVVAAHLRLGQIEVLERTVTKLEAENEQLNNDATRLKEEYQAQQKNLVELEELRIHNRQLVQGVEALEESRREHETDAERYKQKADQSDKLSDTLRFRLDDLQKGFADIEKEQGQALQSARKAAVVPLLRNQG